MAKHCTNCGRELRGDEKFCAECGTAVKGAVSQATPPQWEYGDIEFQLAGHWLDNDGFFVMQVRGPSGIRTERCSRICSSQHYQSGLAMIDGPGKGGQEVLNAAIQNLIAAGWEMLPDRGGSWWSYKFRRNVSAESLRANLPPPPKDFRDLLGQVIRCNGPVESLKVVESYLAVHPDEPFIWGMKAEELGKLGRNSEAYQAKEQQLALIENELAHDPKNKSLWENKIAVLESLRGKEAANEARRQWQAVKRGR